MMSLYPYHESITEMLALGADEYICKSESPQEIIATVSCIASQPKKKKIITINDSEKIISGYCSLTNREKEMLKLSSSDLSYKQIAKKLHISENTIEKHRASLFKKLKVKSRMGLVIKAIKNGWVRW